MNVHGTGILLFCTIAVYGSVRADNVAADGSSADTHQLTAAAASEEADLMDRLRRAPLRFGKRTLFWDNDSFTKKSPMRFGKRAPLRFGKRSSNPHMDLADNLSMEDLMALDHLMKRAPMRFGKRMLGNGGGFDDEDYYDHSQDKRAPMRFGKRSGGEIADASGMYYYDPDYQLAVEDAYEKRAPMRFGKRMVEDADVKRAPMRFGK